MRQTTVQIDGTTVELTKFSAAPGFKMMARIIKLLGGSVLEIAGGMGKSEEDQAKAMGAAIDNIMSRTEPDDLYALVSDLVCGGFTVINGKKVTHLDDLGALGDDTDPFYLGMMIAKEQLMFSFKGALGKLLAAPNG